MSWVLYIYREGSYSPDSSANLLGKTQATVRSLLLPLIGSLGSCYRIGKNGDDLVRPGTQYFVEQHRVIG